MTGGGAIGSAAAVGSAQWRPAPSGRAGGKTAHVPGGAGRLSRNGHIGYL